MKLLNIIPPTLPWAILYFDYKNKGYSLIQSSSKGIHMVKNARPWKEWLNQ